MKPAFLTRPASLLLAAGLFAAGCKGAPEGTAGKAPAATAPALADSPSTDAAAPATAPTAVKVHKLPSGIVYEDLVVGDGRMADPGLTVTVHYTGWFTDGNKFDSSFDHGKPYSFVLGQHEVIDGWDQGLKGMRIGGRRKLTVPPEMAYGAQGRPGIPPNATLVFEVQLVDVK